MNIFKKIKNWLIHLLGGYTRAEFCEELLKRGEAVSTGYDLLNKYNTEHKNYLAMLNYHNAAAEAMQNVAIAADTIKDYCANREDCDGCPLHGECGCKTADKACPEYWD